MTIQTTQKQFTVAGMHCQSCIAKIKSALDAVPGVSTSEVTLSPPRATVMLSEPIDDQRLSEAVGKAGDYRLQGASNDEQASENTTGNVIDGAHTDEPRESLYPLLLIVGFITGVTALVAFRAGSFEISLLMETFMAGFFLVFGFFKLLDLRGFASMYRTYDVIAKTIPTWGWIYPFVEVSLGAAYLLAFAPIATNLITLMLMLVGATGVGLALANKQRIRCACLGSVLNLPMTTVTLIEDLGMAVMAAVMLVMLIL